MLSYHPGLPATQVESLVAIDLEVTSGFTPGTALRLQRRTNIAVAIWIEPQDNYALQRAKSTGMLSFDISRIPCDSLRVETAEIVKQRFIRLNEVTFATGFPDATSATLR